MTTLSGFQIMKPIFYFTLFAYIIAKAGYVKSAPAASQAPCQQKVSLVMPCVPNGDGKLDIIYLHCPQCKCEVPVLVQGKESFIAVINKSECKPSPAPKSSGDSKKTKEITEKPKTTKPPPTKNNEPDCHSPVEVLDVEMKSASSEN